MGVLGYAMFDTLGTLAKRAPFFIGHLAVETLSLSANFLDNHMPVVTLKRSAFNGWNDGHNNAETRILGVAN